MSDILQTAKISSHGPELQNAQSQMHGRKGVCCLAVAQNVPKDQQERISAKPPKILIESFLRRPSLKDEAMNGIASLIQDGIMVEQTANYRVEASLGAMMFIGDRYRVARAGDIVVLHFVDGMLLNPEELDAPADRPPFGTEDYECMEVSELAEFGNGENTFLFCTRSFAAVMTEELLEDTLQRSVYTVDEKHGVVSYDCTRWLKMLRDIFEESNSGMEYAVMANSIPPKKKRPGSKKVVIWVIVAVVAVIVAFLLLGALRRGPGSAQSGPPGGPGQTPPGVSETIPSD